MQTLIKKTDELKSPAKNVRKHSDRQIKEYIRSIEMFGQIRPLVIDENNVILAGNGLWTALKQMGRTTADCYVIRGLSEKQKKKLMLADNRIFELGVNDMDVFDDFLRDLSGDVDIPGFDLNLLENLTSALEKADEIISKPVTFRAEQIATPQKNQELPPRLIEPANRTGNSLPIEPANHEESRPIESSHENQPEQEPATVRRSVTCPKCGEKIWL